MLLVLAAALGPLLSALPSKRQRHIAKQRELAASRGLAVRVRKLPEVPPRLRFTPPDDLICYERVLDGRLKPSWQPGMYVKTREGWVSPDSERLLPEALTALPDGVVLVTLGLHVLQVFWDEKGDEEAVDRIVGVLDELQNPAGMRYR